MALRGGRRMVQLLISEPFYLQGGGGVSEDEFRIQLPCRATQSPQSQGGVTGPRVLMGKILQVSSHILKPSASRECFKTSRR